jgi:hypothetical protein
MEQAWLREALFAGQTANGFKMGTALILGWFWARVNGCRIVYRGASMEGVDFDDVLAVTEPDADKVSLPNYLTHEAGQAYFYVVRCANRCGRIERTLRAAVKVAIDGTGELCREKPNDVFGLNAEQGKDNKIEIVWTYSPIEQGCPAKEMRIYSDEGTGEVDYQNPIATVKYKGRRFYGHRIETPADERYMFAIRAVDIEGNTRETMQTVTVEVHEKDIEAIEIVNIESI